jgi:hypothetical protein
MESGLRAVLGDGTSTYVIAALCVFACVWLGFWLGSSRAKKPVRSASKNAAEPPFLMRLADVEHVRHACASSKEFRATVSDLASGYVSEHTNTIALAADRLAALHMVREFEDGDAALQDAQRYVRVGLQIWPNDLHFQELNSLLAARRKRYHGRRATPPKFGTLLGTLNETAVRMYRVKLYRAALIYCNEAVRLAEIDYGKQSAQFQRCLHNLSAIYRAKGWTE